MKSLHNGFAVTGSASVLPGVMLATIAAGWLLSLGPSTAWAIEEILVTAQKREQNIQDVGIAISAFTGQQIAEFGATNSTDIIQLTPGVRNPKSGSGATSSFSIRGVSQSDYGASQEAPVAMYIDEVYQTNQGAGQFLLFDVDRVEVLRGPQGTLFGRNATGGLIHFISRKPTQDFGGFAEVSDGRFNDVHMEAALNGALTDTLAGRIAIAGRWHDPIAHNSTGPDVWDADQFGARMQLLFQPNSDASFLLAGRFARQRETGQPFIWAAAQGTGPGGTGEFTPGLADAFGFDLAGRGPFSVSIDPVSRHTLDTNGVTATLAWNLGFAELTSITDYNSVVVDYEEDSDMDPGEFFHYVQQQDAYQISEELRLNGDLGKVRWVAGTYYLYWTGDFLQRGLIAGFAIPGVTAQDTVYDSTTSSWSVFGQGELDFAEQFRAILGVRYILDRKAENYVSDFKDVPGGTNVGFGTSPDLLRFAGRRGDNLYAIKAELDWKPNTSTLAYISFNRGVKAGGFNAPLDPSGSSIFIDPNTFDPAPTANDAMRYKPETLNAYEIGTKLTFWDDKARFNVAGFYYDYQNFQSLNFAGVTNFIVSRDATFHGVDAEFFTTPVDGLDIVLGVSWLDHKIKNVSVGDLVLDRKNPYAPKWNATALARYEWPMFSGKLALQSSLNYVGSQFLGLSNAPVLQESAYTLVNARLTYTFARDRLSVAAYADNLTDKIYRVNAFDLGGSFQSVESQYGYPRMYGVTLRYAWGK
jgi:iron complex outermembrane recepter protein